MVFYWQDNKAHWNNNCSEKCKFYWKKFKIYREIVKFTGKGVNFTEKCVYVALIRYRNFWVSCEHFFHLEVKKGGKKDKNIEIHCIEKIQNYICSRLQVLGFLSECDWISCVHPINRKYRDLAPLYLFPPPPQFF